MFYSFILHLWRPYIFPYMTRDVLENAIVRILDMYLRAACTDYWIDLYGLVVTSDEVFCY